MARVQIPRPARFMQTLLPETVLHRSGGADPCRKTAAPLKARLTKAVRRAGRAELAGTASHPGLTLETANW